MGVSKLERLVWKLCSASLLTMGYAIASSGDCALAQITPDATLGTESSVVTPNVDINGVPSDRIDGGAIRGANLFHSFREFNIDPGLGAYFTNPDGIANILSRVTGNDPSDILGRLGVLGNANLFLINPNGIIFGPNASLDIGGSFVGSTASSLNFADGTQFSATAPQTTPLLTVSVPLGLQYGGNAGSVQVQGSGLQVPTGYTLALVGGDVGLDGGILFAPGGRVELGGVSGAGTVGLNVDGNNLSLSYPASVQRADVSLTNDALVSVAAGGGGSIAVNAQNLDVLGGSRLSAGIGTALGSVGSQAGDITLNATGAISIADNSLIGSSVRTGSVGNGSNINIQASSLSLTDGAALIASTIGQGNAGNVTIQVSDTVSFDGESSDGFGSGVFSSVNSGGVGNGGDINITAGSLSVTNGAQLTASTLGQGNAGSVNINARDTVSLYGVDSSGFSSGAFSSVGEGAVGNGGDINITTGSLALTDGALLNASTRGQGDAGSVNINASDTVSFDGVGSNGFSSAAFSAVGEGAVGNGGDINITTGSLALTDGALLNASTRGQGNGGNITLKANTLEAVNGGQVLTTSRSSGNAGSITLNVADNVTLSGSDPTFANRLVQFGEISNAGPASGLFANTASTSTGQGGDLRIATGQLSVRDGAEVSVSSEGAGNAGNLEVRTREIRLDAQGKLTAQSASGNGGDIALWVQDLMLLRGNSGISAISGTEGRGGNAGNILIDTDFFVAIENSDIVASSSGGRGFNFEINSRLGFFLSPDSEIIIDGEDLADQIPRLELSIPEALPAELVDATGLIATGCPEAVWRGESKFIITGRGGLPPDPRGPLNGDNVLTEWNTLDSDVENRSDTKNRSDAAPATNSTKESAPTQIVEANGWIINNKGEVLLTATAPTAPIHIPWVPSTECHTPEP